FGHQDWNTGGGKMKDRHIAKILTNPGDLNKTGSEWDDMGVVSAFKSARWGYDQDAQDKLTASYAKDHWGRAGYNEGREMNWYDADDKDNSFATTKGVPSSPKGWEEDNTKMTSAYDEWKGKADENVHYGKYVDAYSDLNDAWTTHVKPQGKSKWDWGKEHYNTHGKGENRHVSYILDRPGDVDGDGNEYNDMVTTASTNNPTALFGTDATKGKWSEYYWKNNPLATYAPKSAMSAPKELVKNQPEDTQEPKKDPNAIFNSYSNPKDPSLTVNADGTAQYNDTFGRPTSKDSGWTGGWNNPGSTPGVFQDSYQWINNQTGEIWKPDPGRKVDFQPGYKPAPNDGAMEWAEDPRLQEWTKTPVKSGLSYSPKKPGWNEPPRDPKKTPSGFGVNPIGSSADDPLTGDTYIGRGWANYWQQSIPDRDPNWSARFVNQSVKFGDQNQVINRENLVKRIQARTQHHMDQSDYLGYLSRGQMRGENRPNWKQPSPIKSDYQPDININPFLEGIYNRGKDN
ncbi:MAG TPA: hypothetical protein QF698_01885, partial [Candidatus Marinimicrobia bacterium]|nr:hypothetical protein [Candidatus Neomarinimicrobiota bacterium]